MSTAPALAPAIVILASGRGSNAQAILRAVDEGHLRARVLAVISDRLEAPVLDHARTFKVPAEYVDLSDAATRDARLVATIQAHKPQGQTLTVVLAGFMRILGESVIEAFRDPRGFSRVVNIHPSLLPEFPGLHSYRRALEAGRKKTGVTVH